MGEVGGVSVEGNSCLLDMCLAAVTQKRITKPELIFHGKAESLWENMREGEQMMDKTKSSFV